MSKKRVIISACLLGEVCRYDGKTKKVNAVVDAYKEYEIIPFCPEAPLFGTPRERISVVEVGSEQSIITDESRVDVTQKLLQEIDTFLESQKDIDAIVLKSKSPSCGYGTTPILNENREVIKYGNGIAPLRFQHYFPDVAIFDENRF